ncbi:MAG: hypothetical protein JEZ01_04240 [Labilibaculum sp.]|nr:hypothetical protein [Labilibaculum sp.]MBI9056961.1 hypothetical protein [Labilibaculum sp.]
MIEIINVNLNRDELLLMAKKREKTKFNNLELLLELHELFIHKEFKPIEKKVKALKCYINTNLWSKIDHEEFNRMVEYVINLFSEIDKNYTNLIKGGCDEDKYVYQLFLEHRNKIALLINELLEIKEYFSLIQELRISSKEELKNSFNHDKISNTKEAIEWAIKELQYPRFNYREIALFYFYTELKNKDTIRSVANMHGLQCEYHLGNCYVSVVNEEDRYNRDFKDNLSKISSLLYGEGRDKAIDDSMRYEKSKGKKVKFYEFQKVH